MQASYERFSRLPMPTGADEAWRYVDLGVDLEGHPLAPSPGEPLAPDAILRAIGPTSATATVVDGTLTTAVAAEGVELTPVRLLDDDRFATLAASVPPDVDKFAAARAAFGTDGVALRIPSNTVVSRPVVVEVQSIRPAASFPYLFVELGENSEAPVVVVYRSADGAAAVTSPQVGLHVGAGARLRFLSVQNHALDTTAVIHQRVTVGRDGSARIGEVGLGGKLGRLDLGVVLEGAGSGSEVVGLYFGEHDQTLDYRLVITHRGRNTSSDVFLKGAVEDQARSVFTGLLRIEKQATRSSAFETNRNLVLSEGAKAHSVPNLEILCDDVMCGHGSSVGPLDEEHRYYLQSRGLSHARAERLLIKGFFQEAIDRLPVSGIERPLQDEVFARFVEAQAGGRVL